MSEFKDMFKKESREHPTLPNHEVKTIVLDHMREEKESPVSFAYKKLKEHRI